MSRCNSLTKEGKGDQCKRYAIEGNQYCFQHIKCPIPPTVTTEPSRENVSKFSLIPKDILYEILIKIPPYQLFDQCRVDTDINKVCLDPYFRKEYDTYWENQMSSRGFIPALITKNNFLNVFKNISTTIGSNEIKFFISPIGGFLNPTQEELKILQDPLILDINF